MSKSERFIHPANEISADRIHHELMLAWEALQEDLPLIQRAYDQAVKDGFAFHNMDRTVAEVVNDFVHRYQYILNPNYQPPEDTAS